MKKILKGLSLGLVALALTVTVGVGDASAALTVAATSVTTDGVFDLTTVAGSVVTLAAANTTGAITIGGTAQTGTITLGSSSGDGIIDIGAGAGATTIQLGVGGGVDVVTVGDANADVSITDAQWSITGAGVVTTSGLITTNGGLTAGAVNAVTGADTLNSGDCGRITTVTAGIDTAQIVLPEASTVIGCTFTIVYIGADGGALLDISPLDSDADGIEGTCTLAASVVTLSGTADADIGFTKATIQTGDTMELTAVSASQYVMHGTSGICANN